jgi:hypothetical protein
MINPNNILSYFVKDITDLNEKKLYRVYIDYYGFLTICYNNNIIYYRKSYIIENYITNINKLNKSFVKTTKIFKDFANKFKRLYYKLKFKYDNQRSIVYYYHLKKYLLKHNICYNLKTYNRIKIRIIYYNMYKYKYKMYELNKKYKFKSNILFMNKYELNYINTFFRLYIY